MFDRLDRPTQEFFLKTALFPEITPDMADRLMGLKRTVSGFSGKPSATEVLSALSDKNFFTLRLDRRRELYRYHPLFRDFLLSRGREFFTPEEFSEIRFMAASIMEEAGYIETAAELYAEGLMWERLAGIILANAPLLAAHGRTYIVEGWLKHLPEELLSQSPCLLYWDGICRLPYDFSAARKCFRKSYGLFQKSLAASGCETCCIDGAYLSWCGIVDTFIYELGNFYPLDTWIDEFYGLYSLYPFPDSLELNVRVTTSILLALIFRKPIRIKIMPWAQRAGELVKKDMDMNLSLMLVNVLLLYYLSVGKFDDATMLANEFRRDVPHSNVNNVSLIMWKTLDAMVHWNTGYFEDALRSVTDGLAIAEKTGLIYWNTFLYAHGAYSCILGGNLKEAGHYISKMNPALVASRPLDLCQYHFLASWYSLITGDIHDAAGHLQISLKLAETAGWPFPLALNHISSAILLFKTGHRTEALEQIGKAEEIAARMESSLLEFKTLMARTLLCFERVEGKEAIPGDTCVKTLRRPVSPVSQAAVQLPPSPNDLTANGQEINTNHTNKSTKKDYAFLHLFAVICVL
ncbi:MAG: hypothetical protein HQK89_07340 [Nitrospirae bacterium]|nr:hypothetical protein [Nitrospirota bacterium]